MKKKTKILIIVIAVLLVTLIPIGITYSKYISNYVLDYYLSSKGFYFSSDQLSVEGFESIDNTWDGGKVNFNLKNSNNNKLITDYDISYNVSCEVEGNPSIACNINNGSTNITNGIISSQASCENSKDATDVSTYDKTRCEVEGYKWKNNEVVTDLYFELSSSNEIEDAIVNVTATATEPYGKTLTGKFTLSKNTIINEVSMDLEKYDDYYRLVISNPFTDDRCIRVSYDSTNLKIDAKATDFSYHGVDGNDFINEFEILIKSNNSKDYIFYGINQSIVHDIKDFTLVNSNGCK